MIRRTRFARWRAFAAMLVLALGATCAEPKPNYPPLEAPVVGTIAAEMNVVTTGGAQQIDMAADEATARARLTIHVPAGAYPVGTKVTARLLRGLTMPVNACVVLTRLSDTTAGYLALQILPQQPSPSVPLRVEYHPSVQRWVYQILHAQVADAAWTVTETFVLSSPRLSFAVAESGLWRRWSTRP